MFSPHKTSPPKYLATYNLMCLEGIQPNQFKGLQVLKLHLNKCLVCQGMRFHKKHVEFLGVPDFFPFRVLPIRGSWCNSCFANPLRMDSDIETPVLLVVCIYMKYYMKEV